MSNVEQVLDTALQRQRSGAVKEAEVLYRQVLFAHPNHVPAMFHLGMLCQAQNRLSESVELLEKAVRLQPDFVSAHNSLGVALARQKNYAAAVVALERSIALRPDLIDLQINLGNIYKSWEKFELAIQCYSNALRLNAANAEAHNLLGGVYSMLGRLPEGIRHFEEALRLNPRNAATHSNLLLAMNYLPNMNSDVLLAEHRFWWRLHGRGLTPPPIHANDRNPDRRLRVGYVSPDFRKHAVAAFLEPIFRHHDPTHIEMFAYAEVPNPDSVTAHFKSLAHHWRSTCGQSDVELAKHIREDEIDILVDLAGHSASNRLTVFAQMPAPVQVTYLGYPNSTGLCEITYRLTDAIVDPSTSPGGQREELVRLDGCFCVYNPIEQTPDVAPPPAMRKRHITFGSLHNLAKLNRETISLWCSVMRAMPTSRMLVFRNTLQGKRRQQLGLLFADGGIAPERVDLLYESSPPMDYLRIYEDVDIHLDALPWSGHVTTCESLWMGVPVITLRGSRSSGRLSASILRAIGRPEWIAETPSDFVAIACRLAEDDAKLLQIRSTLRQQMRSSILCDGAAFCRRLESEYRRIWRHACDH